MKRIFLICLLAVSVAGASAQKIDKVNDLLAQKKLDQAKVEIDKILENEKFQKNADVWYAKAKVYAAIADDSNVSPNVPGARDVAFEALKKYIDLETQQKYISLQFDQFRPLMSIYSGYFQQGANDFNNKQYEQAFNSFLKAGAVSNLMTEKKWANTPLDTTIILYTAVAAQNAKKEDSAAKYYQILTDHKVNGQGMEDCYKWLADYYARKEDIPNAQKYLALGGELFPKDPFWASMELDILRESGDKDALFAKYEQILADDPRADIFYNYALELYQHGYNPDITKRPANSVELISKVESNLKKVLELQPDNHQAALVLGQVYYNRGVDHQNLAVAAKGTKPEEVKKRADEKAAAIAEYDLAMPYLDMVQKKLSPMGKLKMDDRTALKNALDLMIIIYDQKGQKDKMKEFEVKYNNVDKEH